MDSPIEKVDKMHSLDILSCINPLFFVVCVIYGCGKILQWIFNTQSIWQLGWDKAIVIFGTNDFYFTVLGLTLCTMSIYWFFGIIFMITDVTLKPLFIRKFKVQIGTNEPVDMKRISKAIGMVLFNQIIIGFPIAAFGYFTGIMKPDITSNLPSFQRVMLDLIVSGLGQEFFFYYSHRVLHGSFFYKTIHKKHHEWKSPVGVTAVYAHPIEHIFSNIIPVISGAVIMRSHYTVVLLWLTIVHITTITDHSGYHLPFFHSSQCHDFHHLKFTECFGVYGIMDYFHGTDLMFRQTLNFQRHNTIFSLKAATEIVPQRSNKSLN